MGGNQRGANPIADALAINQIINPFLTRITRISNDAESINILNPFSIGKYNEIKNEMKNMRLEYDRNLALCYNTFGLNPDGAMGADLVHLRILSRGIAAVLRMQSSWEHLGATLDTKGSLIAAMIAIYLSIFLTLGPLVWNGVMVPLYVMIVDP